MKKALITGVTGQDGSYLAEFLLEKGYKVYGVVRRVSIARMPRLEDIGNLGPTLRSRLTLLDGDLGDTHSLYKILEKVQPDEIYNLAAQSHVRISFDVPEYTADITGIGALRILEAIRHLRLNTKFYQASSSELFGRSTVSLKNEKTFFQPVSPYAVAKLFAYWTTVNYREGYGLFACNGVLFNHESPRRGENFVTRKITLAVARIRRGLQKTLTLGNLEAKRDWGYAKDYVEAMWLMLQQKKADDFVIATGQTHSVREFVKEAFTCVGLDYKKYVKTDKKLLRPLEVHGLRGDYSKAKKVLGWKPKTSFKELVRLMVEADLQSLEKQEHS